MRIRPEQTVAVGIDFQEKLVPAMHGSDELIAKSQTLLAGLRVLNIPVCLTQQYTKGLGMSLPSIFEAAGTDSHTDKLRFSAFEDIKPFLAGKKYVVVLGIEAHVCVLQTIVDLAENGYIPVLAADCVTSRRPESVAIALQRARDEGAVITNCESILFELLQTAGTDASKQIQKLIR